MFFGEDSIQGCLHPTNSLGKDYILPFFTQTPLQILTYSSPLGGGTEGVAFFGGYPVSLVLAPRLVNIRKVL